MVTAADIVGDRTWLTDEAAALIETATATIDKTAPAADDDTKSVAVEMFVQFMLGRLEVDGDPWTASGAAVVLRRFTVRRAVTL